MLKSLPFPVGSEPVEVDLLGQKLRRPKTAFNRPQPDFFSGMSSSILADGVVVRMMKVKDCMLLSQEREEHCVIDVKTDRLYNNENNKTALKNNERKSD